jgi:hypothetical protein
MPADLLRLIAGALLLDCRPALVVHERCARAWKPVIDEAIA